MLCIGQRFAGSFDLTRIDRQVSDPNPGFMIVHDSYGLISAYFYFLIVIAV